ncbi:hypothetical protein MKX01_041143 [Papaver californicum]|nr:hypothetical protein MKX01_041143 [Papaver californicum]
MDTEQIEIQLPERRIRYDARRSSLTETEREKIREIKLIAYLKRRSTTASDQAAVMSSATEGTRDANLNLHRSPRLTHHFQTQPETWEDEKGTNTTTFTTAR